MMKLKVIAFFLSLILLLQMLPLQQIGQALSQSQWTEELPHGDDCPVKSDYHPFHQTFLPPQNYIEFKSGYSISKTLAYIHSSEQIPHNHSSDIETPPPDFFI